MICLRDLSMPISSLISLHPWPPHTCRSRVPMPPAADAQFILSCGPSPAPCSLWDRPPSSPPATSHPPCLLLPARPPRRHPSLARLSAPSALVLRIVFPQCGHGRLRWPHPQCASRQSSTSSPLSTDACRTAGDEAEVVVAASSQYTAYCPFLGPSIYQKPCPFHLRKSHILALRRNLPSVLRKPTHPQRLQLVQGYFTSGEAASAFASKPQEAMTNWMRFSPIGTLELFQR